MAATTIVFWSALALGFLALAVVAQIEARAIKRLEHGLGEMPHALIPTPVARALDRILMVEALGFVLAFAAAMYEAFAVP